MKSSPLPRLGDLPMPVYPPSSYPPPSYFEEANTVYPALVVPAKRTSEMQRTLHDLIFQEPRRKSVYPVEEGLDYTIEDDQETKYDPKRERKLALVRIGGPPTAQARHGNGHDDVEGEDPASLEANDDGVWQDERLRSLLESVASSAPSGDEKDDAASTAPRGKAGMASIRKSYIRLPTTRYDLMSVDQILRRIMPTSDGGDERDHGGRGVGDIEGNDSGYPIVREIPSSFEIAGHIAHVNLNDEALPYKFLIGRAILDKNRPRIRLVVNKIGNIENEFRTFPMEILAAEENVGISDFSQTAERLCAGACGESSTTAAQVKIGPQHRSLMQVEVREHGCRFLLDFARVYFNSRLQGEHARLVDLIVRDAERCKVNRTSKSANVDAGNLGTVEKEWTIVADAMAGVGPFAIPLTSPSVIDESTTKIICHANDLNPISYEYLQKNARLNKCALNRLYMYNSDARQFIHRMNEERVDVDHFIMNLPQLAPEFLDAFRGWKFHDCDDLDPSLTCSSDKKQVEQRSRRRRMRLPMIHVHCFGEKPRSPEDVTRVERQVQQRCEEALGCPGCFDSTTMTVESSDGAITTPDLATNNSEFRIRVVRDVGPRKNMLCVSFRLPLVVGDVRKLSLSQKGGGSMYNNRVHSDGDATDFDLADAASVGGVANGKTKRGNDIVSEEIGLQHSKLMRL